MNFTNDMIEKAKTAASADELLKMAKENGVNMTSDEAQEYFNFLNANGELSEDAQAQVAGGKNDDPTYWDNCSKWNV